MKTEISAGGLIVRKRGKRWQILLIKDKKDYWTFPKGKIEEGESKRTTANREISEEVGLNGLIFVKALRPIHYWYRRDGLVSKTVHYFIFRYDGDETPVGQDEEGIHDPTWTSFSKAIKIIGYPESAMPLLLQTQAFLSTI